MSERARPWLKICGVTNEEDARLAADAGADAIGLNFVATSKRRVDDASARRIADAVRGRVELVGVVANETAERLRTLLATLELDFLQLHGDEAPSLLAEVPRTFKAVGIASAADVEQAARYAGERLLVDAKHGGASGGTGRRFDWSFVRELAQSRRLILAGGLTPENVAEAVTQVQPWGLDVASGVESGDPRRKDPDLVFRFIDNARRAGGER
ncbi:MAG TPA: phosphoribosylanthranilate isomerase [Polyangiaceae bacterium]|nr:phosphoribosylanthranilate isomerase [Polyangiaceae bacterium]